MEACLICEAEVVGANLCAGCGDELPAPQTFCAEQIVSTALRPTQGVLIDRWGRGHRLDAEAMIGRRLQRSGVRVLEASVSRQHLRLDLQDDGHWLITDQLSANGTSIDNEEIQKPTVIKSRQQLVVGGVGFYFLAEAPNLVPTSNTLIGLTIQPGEFTEALSPGDSVDSPESDDGDITFPGFPEVEMSLHEPSGGGGAVLEAFGRQVQLSLAQSEFVRMLAQQMHDDRSEPDLVRGFVSSGRLLAEISWDTPAPNENHLKQLVRRVRRSLEQSGFGRLIQSQRGFGYRMRVVPLRRP